MLKRVQLTLMIGPAVPVPAPREILDALESVQVVSQSGDAQSGFELTFGLSKRSPLHTIFLLSGGAAIPILRVVIVVTVGGLSDVLMDGVMTNHEVRDAEGGPTLVVKGKDLTALMDILEFDGLPFPATSPAMRVAAILLKYAVLGIAPAVVPSVIEDIPIPVERIPQQQGTDYKYITALAEQCGHVFYLVPGPTPLMSRAYWGPDIRVGLPQPALNTDMDAHTNVESLSFSFDREAKEMPVVYIQEPITKAPVPIPIPDITPLSPPLGLVPPLPVRLRYLSDTAMMSPFRAAMRGLAYASQHSDCVSGQGSLDVVRYGRPLKSRQLVGVRGAGMAFDGLYYVKSVTHSIKRGEYKQNFSLARNALVSTMQSVPT